MWQMVALIDSADGLYEVKHHKIYLDEDFAMLKMNYEDGELFAEELTIDIDNGMFGEGAILDDIELREVE
jgi:hypothetical protein